MSKNHSLLFVVHGSRLAESNLEMTRMVQSLNKKPLPYQKISIAFLELEEPSIPNGLDELISAGAEEISIFPYFLTAGKHVSVDIPNIIDSYKSKYPKIIFTLLDYFGKNEKTINFIETILKKS